MNGRLPGWHRPPAWAGAATVLMGLIGLLGGLRPPVAWGVVLLLAGLVVARICGTPWADVWRLALPLLSRWQRWFLLLWFFSLSPDPR